MYLNKRKERLLIYEVEKDIAAIEADTNYLLADGSRPLTADWPSGSFTITLGKATLIGVGSLPIPAVIGQVVFLTTDLHLYLGI